MSRILIGILIAALAALLPACAFDPWAGQPAPDFSTKDLAGNDLSLSDYRGKVVLLDFWATWCGPCISELPNVKSVYNKHKDDDFMVIGISLDVDQYALQMFIRQQGIEWPQVFDGKGWENEVSQLYRVNAIPATFLLDHEGVIRYTNLRGSQLERAVEKLLRVRATR